LVKGSKSVEVRPVGISKGLAMSRIINAIAARDAQESVQYDFVLVAGHFLVRDENIFTFFEGQSLKVSSSSRLTQGLWHEHLWKGLIAIGAYGISDTISCLCN